MNKFIAGFLIALVGYSVVNAPKPEPMLCLIANEADQETSYHMMIRVAKNEPEYYITGQSWDHLNHEWVDMYPRLIEKRIAPDYVTETLCPPQGLAP